MSYETIEKIKQAYFRPVLSWNTVGSYLSRHPRLAVTVEAVLYTALSFTLVKAVPVVLGYQPNSRPCPIVQERNVRGTAARERFVQIGKEIFYSRIDEKDISKLVK